MDLQNENTLIEVKDNSTIDLINSKEEPKARKNKTADYTLRASKKYRERNPEKIKAYYEKYKALKVNKNIFSVPNNKLTKTELINKIETLEENMKTLQIKLNELEKTQTNT
jgi:hypothetical protein